MPEYGIDKKWKKRSGYTGIEFLADAVMWLLYKDCAFPGDIFRELYVGNRQPPTTSSG